MLNLQQVCTLAQALSPVRFYNPELSADYPFFRALAEQVPASRNYVFPLTVAANAAYGTPVAFHRVTSSNTQAGVFLLAVYVECNTAGSGTIVFRVNWTYNGGAGAETTTIALAATDANINSTYLMVYADVGTDFTYDYEVTGYGAGSATVRMVASLTQLI